MRMRKCTCGSGDYGTEVYDARGIYVCIVCDACEREKRSHYRPEIFTDCGYATDEPVDED